MTDFVSVAAGAGSDDLVLLCFEDLRTPGLLERQPKAFSTMDEEALRDLLLVALNNQFGAAVGEMFSRQGKTDIAIVQGKGPVFIAECKIWPGEKKFLEAIEQLFRYLVWRDTKAALVVFVQERNVTAISDKALAALAGHPRRVAKGAPVGGTCLPNIAKAPRLARERVRVEARASRSLHERSLDFRPA